jgi:hypothetical protein
MHAQEKAKACFSTAGKKNIQSFPFGKMNHSSILLS